MLQPNPIWRYRYYEADLQTVLAIFYKNMPVNPRPRLNTALIITNQERPQHESPSSARSNYSSNSTNSVTATLTPSTYPGSSGSPSNDQHFISTPDLSPSNSPIELPAHDSSPMLAPTTGKRTSLRCDKDYPSSTAIKLPAPDSSSLLSSSTANNRSKRCSLCNTPFSGSRRDQTNNLRRHKRTIHYPSEFPCPEPDCHKTFNRKDNLKKHRRDKHVDEIVWSVAAASFAHEEFGWDWNEDYEARLSIHSFLYFITVLMAMCWIFSVDFSFGSQDVQSW